MGCIGSKKMNDEKEPAKVDKYEVQSAVDTLIRAEEIKSDENLMKEVRPLLEKKKKAIHGAMPEKIDSFDKLKKVISKKQADKEAKDSDAPVEKKD